MPRSARAQLLLLLAGIAATSAGTASAENHGGSLAWSRESGRTCFRVEVPLVLS